MARQAVLPTLQSLSLRLLATIGASLLGLIVVRALVPPEALRDCNDSVGNYLQTVATIFSVLQAFVVFVVWTQFNEARLQVEREANEIVDLARTTEALPEPLASQLQAHLGHYADAVLEQEWKAMASSGMSVEDAGGVILERAFAELRAFEPATQRDAALFSEALSRFNELYNVRTARVTSACSRVPMGLMLLLYSGGVVIIGSMYLLTVSSFGIHALITSAVAGAISHILYVVHDLDNCFSGDWQVQRSAFERARHRIATPSRSLAR
jgi:hypothetical protein